MYTQQQLKAMTGAEFNALLKPMTRDEMGLLLAYVRGYAPDALAAALNDDFRVTCRKVYVAADDGKARACQRQPHASGSHWVYDEDNWPVHDGPAAPLVPVAEEVAEP